MIQPPPELQTFDSLLKVVEALRGPDGCPWDKEQTHSTLTRYAIEEAHELADAIEQGDQSEIISELGDVLLQVVLHAEIARQEGRFQIADIIETLNKKMIYRHPHVFGDVKVQNIDQVWANWAELKKAEKKSTPAREDRFDIPAHLPALMKAEKIGSKTKKLRFDWADVQGVLRKVDEELQELREAIEEKAGTEELAHEVGDLLFTAAQVARHLQLDPEQCLRQANRRFEKRFFGMQKLAKKDGRELQNLSETELEAYWQKIKQSHD